MREKIENLKDERYRMYEVRRRIRKDLNAEPKMPFNKKKIYLRDLASINKIINELKDKEDKLISKCDHSGETIETEYSIRCCDCGKII